MEFIDTPFAQTAISSSLIEPDRHRKAKGPLPELGIPDESVLKIFFKRFLSISQKFDAKCFYFAMAGVDIYPEHLVNLTNDLVKKLGFISSTKAQCKFYVWDAFIHIDLQVDIAVPGNIKLRVNEQNGEKRNARLQDLDRCYISSVLRYFNIIENNTGKGLLVDPFEEDFDKFQHFLSTLCRITRDYDIKFQKPFSKEQIHTNYKAPFRLALNYIKHRKLYSWVKKYFVSVEIDPKNCIKQSPHMVRFYIQLFASAEQRQLVLSFLFNENISQVLPSPLQFFYLSKITKDLDEQLYLLKTISYTNKTEIWSGIVSCYLKNRYSNFGILAKSLLALDFLAQKNDESVGNKNFMKFQFYCLPLKRKIQFLPQISCYPHDYRSLKYRYVNLKENNMVDKQIAHLRKLLEMYYSLSPLKRQVVVRLAKILKATGRPRFKVLYKETFESDIKRLDSVESIQHEEQSHPTKQTLIDLDSQQEPFPSFIAADLEDRIILIKKYDFEDSNAQFIQEEDTTERYEQQQTQNHQASQSIKQTKHIQHYSQKFRKIASPAFKELVNLALEIRESLDQIVVKLGVNPTKIQTLRNLNLSLQNAMVMAEATMLSGHFIFAAQMLFSIKKRMQDVCYFRIDLYTYSKLFHIMVLMNNFHGLLVLIADFITDLKMLGIVDVYRLPCWVEDELFEVISQKGRVYVQNIAKSLGVASDALRNSILWYGQLRKNV